MHRSVGGKRGAPEMCHNISRRARHGGTYSGQLAPFPPTGQQLIQSTAKCRIPGGQTATKDEWLNVNSLLPCPTAFQYRETKWTPTPLFPLSSRPQTRSCSSAFQTDKGALPYPRESRAGNRRPAGSRFQTTIQRRGCEMKNDPAN